MTQGVNRKTRVCGLILAGGKARRFGKDKRFADLGGKPLIQHAIDRLAPQVDELVLSANDTIPGSEHLVHLADQRAEQGPLLGIAEGLAYARDEGFDWLITAPADSPFFPFDMTARLLDAQENPAIRFAFSAGRIHPVFGAWPVAVTAGLFAEIAEGERKIDRAAEALTGVHSALWPIDPLMGDPFFNVNRDSDMKRAEDLYASRSLSS